MDRKRADRDGNDTKTAILDSAERRARLGGYGALSFRDIAADIGIKSASVHYHYPTKSDLAAALMARYAARFVEALPQADPPAQAVAALISAYRQVRASESAMCLGVVFGAERAALTAPVQREVGAFYRAQIQWLAGRFAKARLPDPKGKAAAVVSFLTGGLVTAQNMGSDVPFETATQALLPLLDAPARDQSRAA